MMTTSSAVRGGNDKRTAERAGIEIEIKKVKWEDELNGVQSGKFDMALIGCTVASIPDISFLYSSAQIGQGLIFPVTAMKRLTGILLDFEGKGSVNEESLFY